MKIIKDMGGAIVKTYPGILTTDGFIWAGSSSHTAAY